MNLIKKLSGSFLVGLTVIGLALSTSAFTSHEAVKNQFAGEIYVNNNGNYELLNEPYDKDKCQSNDLNTCAWKRTEEPGHVPDAFSSTEAEGLESQGLIERMDANNGIYVQ